MRPLGSDPCQIRTTCAETPDRTLGLSCARTQMTVSRKSMSWEAEPHTASWSSRSSHSRQIHASPRVSRALSVAGTMVTPQAGQIGGRSSSTPGVWSLEQLGRRTYLPYRTHAWRMIRREGTHPLDPAIVIGPGSAPHPETDLLLREPARTRRRAGQCRGGVIRARGCLGGAVLRERSEIIDVEMTNDRQCSPKRDGACGEADRGAALRGIRASRSSRPPRYDSGTSPGR